MYLFGGKFCKFMDEELGERECTCPEIIAKHPLCECDRKHFNNFLWATVTVFQVSLVFALPPSVPIVRLLKFHVNLLGACLSTFLRIKKIH